MESSSFIIAEALSAEIYLEHCNRKSDSPNSSSFFGTINSDGIGGNSYLDTAKLSHDAEIFLMSVDNDEEKAKEKRICHLKYRLAN